MSCDTTFKIYHAQSLMCVREVPERRRLNGTLENPPRIFVIAFDPELNQVRGHETPWPAAAVLARRSMADIIEMVERDRNEEADVAAAAAKALRELVPPEPPPAMAAMRRRRKRS